MALGLRFAGSANSDAFDSLYEFARNFMKIMSFAGTAAVVSVSSVSALKYILHFVEGAYKVVAFIEILLSACSFRWHFLILTLRSLSLSTYVLVPPADGILQLADWSVDDPVVHVHGDVRHRESEGPAALSLLPQANWWGDELWLSHGSSHGTGPAVSGRRQVRQHKMYSFMNKVANSSKRT